eukprot:MONOS_11939.1-p1 / transcript=MONOS_11939.1 / gene=MONOS_11939 / organism=Monocercomonoides_exilis_PA203 / gene_product=unspecified product / transcript_product=unspecified product / location=Mono_scaffold00628:3658-6102(+) / protein_length=814 / sequence_SO=supercontig / SO=protein_coding / is_pseudo=false
MRDGNTQVQFPCTQPFSWIFPFGLSVETDINNSSKKPILRFVKHSLSGITNKAISEYQQPQLVNKIITRIVIQDEDENTKETALETIAKWADENIPFSRTPGGRLNYAIAKYWSTRPLSLFPSLPSFSVTVWYLENDDDLEEEAKETVVSFFGFSTVDVKDIEELCPMKDAEKEKAFKNGKVKEQEEILKNNKENQRDDHNKVIKANQKTNKRAKIPTVFDLIREERFNRITSQSTIPSNKTKQSQTKALGNDLPKYTVIHNGTTIRGYKVSDTNIGILSIESFQSEDEIQRKELAKGIADTLNKLKQDNVAKLIIDLTSCDGDDVALGNGMLRMLFPSVYPVYGAVDIPNTELNAKAMEKLRKENGVQLTDTFTMLDAGDVFANKVEQTESGQGVTRSRQWTKTFSINYDKVDPFPDVLNSMNWLWKNKRPFDPNNIIVLTDSMCGSVCTLVVKHMRELHLAKMVSFGGDPLNKGIPLDLASVGAGYVLDSDEFESVLKQSAKESSSAEEASNSYSSSLSSSSSSISSSQSAHNFSPLLGASSISSSLLSSNSSFPKTRSALPSPFLRKTAKLTMTITNQHSHDSSTPDDSLEFKICDPDVTLNFYPSPDDDEDEGRVLLSERVKGVFDRCFEWQVKETHYECANAEGHRENEVWGRPCNASTNTFDETKCVFARCADGYYLSSETKKCELIPKFPWEDMEVDDSKKKISTAASVVIAVLSVLVVGGIIAVVIFIIWKKRKESAHIRYRNMGMNKTSAPRAPKKQPTQIEMDLDEASTYEEPDTLSVGESKKEEEKRETEKTEKTEKAEEFKM